MLKSDKTDIRSITIRRILEIRVCKKEGQIINRISKIPEINIDARLWYELINIFEITNLPSHSQSVERSVHLFPKLLIVF